MQNVKLFSDGSARGNPDGPGGYGVVLQYTDSKGELHEMELSKGFPKTTNNRMELLGIITGLEHLKRPCRVEVYSDSQYVINAFQKGWLKNWVKNGWKKAAKQPVLDPEHWERRVAAAETHEITWNWVKGHAGHPENERCDKLATKAADSMKVEM